MTLHARPADPRDVTLEESDPTYRVALWSDDGLRCRTYDLTGADDVAEVIEWAESNVQAGEIYILGVRWQESSPTINGGDPFVAFIRIKGDPPPGQSVGNRVG